MLFWSHEVWGAGLRSKVLEPESQVENRSRVKWGAWANQSGGGFWEEFLVSGLQS